MGRDGAGDGHDQIFDDRSQRNNRSEVKHQLLCHWRLSCERGLLMKIEFSLALLALGCLAWRPALAEATATDAPQQRCVRSHGAWCVLQGAAETHLSTGSSSSSYRLSDPSHPASALIVVAPVACMRGYADQISLRSFEHGIAFQDEPWEEVVVDLRADGSCGLRILLPPSGSSPTEWAFSTGLQLIRACKSESCLGPSMGELKPFFATRYRNASTPIARPSISD